MIVTSSDGVTMEFDGSASNIFKFMLEDCADVNQQPIPVPNVTADTLKAIQKIQEDGVIDESWEMLWNVANASIFLQMDDMLDRVCRQMALMLKGKSPTEVRRLMTTCS